MSIRENEHVVPNIILPRNVLVSVFDKSGLTSLVDGLVEVNPQVMFYSTGGTGKEVVELLGDLAETNYSSVEDFTGAPEMDGGLVKTLHPKIHAGLLAERGNPEHVRYLEGQMKDLTGSVGVYFDVMVGNLYPFNDVIEGGATPEKARVNIDIGGPTMVMASAKNWHSVAVLTSPVQYEHFVAQVRKNGGTTLEQRFQLAQGAMQTVGEYRSNISDHFLGLDFERDVKPNLSIEGGNT